MCVFVKFCPIWRDLEYGEYIYNNVYNPKIWIRSEGYDRLKS